MAPFVRGVLIFFAWVKTKGFQSAEAAAHHTQNAKDLRARGRHSEADTATTSMSRSYQNSADYFMYGMQVPVSKGPSNPAQGVK